MKLTSILRRHSLLGIAAAIVFLLGPATAADLNPAAISYTPPDKIKWVVGANGEDTAIITGDPDKPGLYVELVKWHAGHMSRPHYHPNNRYITVLSGTWWVGTGSKFDPSTTVPMPTGSVVTHFAKQIHWDGAKDQDTVLEIVGEGPATATPAETK